MELHAAGDTMFFDFTSVPLFPLSSQWGAAKEENTWRGVDKEMSYEEFQADLLKPVPFIGRLFEVDSTTLNTLEPAKSIAPTTFRPSTHRTRTVTGKRVRASYIGVGDIDDGASSGDDTIVVPPPSREGARHCDQLSSVTVSAPHYSTSSFPAPLVLSSPPPPHYKPLTLCGESTHHVRASTRDLRFSSHQHNYSFRVRIVSMIDEKNHVRRNQVYAVDLGNVVAAKNVVPAMIEVFDHLTQRVILPLPSGPVPLLTLAGVERFRQLPLVRADTQFASWIENDLMPHLQIQPCHSHCTNKRPVLVSCLAARKQPRASKKQKAVHFSPMTKELDFKDIVVSAAAVVV